MAADPRASRILVVEDDIAIGPQLVAGLIREGDQHAGRFRPQAFDALA